MAHQTIQPIDAPLSIKCCGISCMLPSRLMAIHNVAHELRHRKQRRQSLAEWQQKCNKERQLSLCLSLT